MTIAVVTAGIEWLESLVKKQEAKAKAHNISHKTDVLMKLSFDGDVFDIPPGSEVIIYRRPYIARTGQSIATFHLPDQQMLVVKAGKPPYYKDLRKVQKRERTSPLPTRVSGVTR